MTAGTTVRLAATTDLSAIDAIFNYYVTHSIAVFEEQPLAPAQRRSWFEQYTATGPHRLLVAQVNGVLAGYASSQSFRRHAAFRECVETSIMLSPDRRGQGIGSTLYTRLFEHLATQPIHRAYAGIALPNPASCALHEKFGFHRIALYDEYAIKNGRRISSGWYEKRMDALG